MAHVAERYTLTLIESRYRKVISPSRKLLLWCCFTWWHNSVPIKNWFAHLHLVRILAALVWKLTSSRPFVWNWIKALRKGTLAHNLLLSLCLPLGTLQSCMKLCHRGQLLEASSILGIAQVENKGRCSHAFFHSEALKIRAPKSTWGVSLQNTALHGRGPNLETCFHFHTRAALN